MPLIGSVVDFWKNSGTISTIPPTSRTNRINTIIKKLLVSIFSCDKPELLVSLAIFLFSLGVGSDGGDGHSSGPAGSRGLQGVPQHDQHAAQVEQTAKH